MSSLIIEVCTIDSIIKHPNADKLSLVGIKGWNVIVGLDQYKVGDLAVYCPPDSIIPTNLIEKYNLGYLRKDGRVKSIKLRGYLSQGLLLDVLEENWKAGDNVAEVLGITKWIPPEAPTMRGARQVSKKKINPLFSRYTDIENIKNYNEVFKDGDIVVFTEKLHGASFRAGNLEITIDNRQPLLYRVRCWFKKYILKQTHEFVWGSHNVQITHHDNRHNYYGEDIWSKMAEKYNLKNLIPEDYIVYGEAAGLGIQDLTYGLNGVDLFVFDVKYKDKYLSWYEFIDFCEKLNLKTVPLLYIGYFSNDLLELHTNGKSLLCPIQIREGCVVKMVVEESNPQIGRKILKSMSPDYLLRKNGTEFR